MTAAFAAGMLVFLPLSVHAPKARRTAAVKPEDVRGRMDKLLQKGNTDENHYCRLR